MLPIGWLRVVVMQEHPNKANNVTMVSLLWSKVERVYIFVIKVVPSKPKGLGIVCVLFSF